MSQRRLWTGREPGGNPFALPRGVIGHLAGWVLARSNRDQNAEVLDFLDVGAGERVLEVGHGPGVLVELLARRPDVTVEGVDPSAEMVHMARRRNAEAVRAGRVRLRTGAAAATGLAAAAVDLVVSVNTVAMWPDLAAGVAEFHRVLRPGGRAVITWHGGTGHLALRPDELDTIESTLRAEFGDARRHLLERSVVFTAAKAPARPPGPR
ncbi:SAM-dependent methyltransferase [Spinactinospora alkalitolerans]|uniref:SAM-dependent methyltransferase n=1 Tax=Spinactinospora alkalitolerans TaxID=687207 RepID=A0A852U400_9ACTN|nr:methyltransferase domain-containing protein [Spinactinospora alkalitolerans]NYE48834.1 SAM-dependent methyltransferase [Spinactinospora alkalitolerans]